MLIRLTMAVELVDKILVIMAKMSISYEIGQV